MEMLSMLSKDIVYLILYILCIDIVYLNYLETDLIMWYCCSDFRLEVRCTSLTIREAEVLEDMSSPRCACISGILLLFIEKCMISVWVELSFSCIIHCHRHGIECILLATLCHVELWLLSNLLMAVFTKHEIHFEISALFISQSAAVCNGENLDAGSCASTDYYGMEHYSRASGTVPSSQSRASSEFSGQGQHSLGRGTWQCSQGYHMQGQRQYGLKQGQYGLSEDQHGMVNWSLYII